MAAICGSDLIASLLRKPITRCADSPTIRTSTTRPKKVREAELAAECALPPQDAKPGQSERYKTPRCGWSMSPRIWSMDFGSCSILRSSASLPEASESRPAPSGSLWRPSVVTCALVGGSARTHGPRSSVPGYRHVPETDYPTRDHISPPAPDASEQQEIL